MTDWLIDFNDIRDILWLEVRELHLLYIYTYICCIVKECLSSEVHLLTALYNPTLCLLHRAWGSITKDKEKKSWTQSLTDWTCSHGGVCVRSDLPLTLFTPPPHARSLWITFSSRGISRLWVHLWLQLLSLTKYYTWAFTASFVSLFTLAYM